METTKNARRIAMECLLVTKQDILLEIPADVSDDEIMNWMVSDKDRWFNSIVDTKDHGAIGTDERVLDCDSKKVLIDWGGWRKPYKPNVVKTEQIPPWEWADDDLPEGFTR